MRELVRPALREAGFAAFSGRAAWRTHAQTVDLIVFRSFTSYLAGAMGCTTYSFAVTAGVFYQCTASADLDKPKDYQLTFRFELGKTLRQPWFGAGSDRPDVWYVLPDGSNLDDCVHDARDMVLRQALPLVDRFTVAPGAFQALLTEASRDPDFGSAGISMPGAPDGPRWREVALAVGHLVVDNPREYMRTAPVLRAGLP
jgi:hypothetical protein